MPLTCFPTAVDRTEHAERAVAGLPVVGLLGEKRRLLAEFWAESVRELTELLEGRRLQAPLTRRIYKMTQTCTHVLVESVQVHSEGGFPCRDGKLPCIMHTKKFEITLINWT